MGQREHPGTGHVGVGDHQATRVMIVDDDLLVRSSLSERLPRHGTIIVTAAVPDGEGAVARAAEDPPDVVLMDTGMPGTSSVDATRLICRANPGIRVLALTSFTDHATIDRILCAGAIGCLLKDTPLAAMACAIDATRHGLSVMSPAVQESAGQFESPRLTTTERQVLELVCDGLTNTQIAEKVLISPSTAKHCISQLMVRLGASNRARLAYVVGRNRIV